jgi:hypothetical protein
MVLNVVLPIRKKKLLQALTSCQAMLNDVLHLVSYKIQVNEGYSYRGVSVCNISLRVFGGWKVYWRTNHVK